MAYNDLITQLAIAYDIASPINAQSIPWDDEPPTREAPGLQRLILAACQIYDDMAGGAE
jgi:hypothetical protein